MSLTKDKLRDLAPRDRTFIEWDRKVTGLGVRVTPNGAKAFVLNYRNADGASRRMTLGRVGQLKLADARDLALDHLSAIRKGDDPLGARQARRAAPTCAELFDRYLKEYATARKVPASIYEETRMIKRHLRPAFGTRKVASVDMEDIEKLHRKLVATPVQANRVLALASKIFQLAERWRIRPEHSNPCRLIERYPEAHRERYYSARELSAIGMALDALESGDGVPQANPFAVLALRLALFLGLRIGEVRHLRWEDVDLETRTIVLPKTKTGARVHSLPTAAQALLADAPRAGEFVIAGRLDNKPMHYTAVFNVWKRAREMAGLKDARIHDLRHTIATMAAETGAGAHLVRDLIGHKTLAMANLYVGRMDEPVRDLRERVAGAVDAALKGKSGKVMPLKGGRDG